MFSSVHFPRPSAASAPPTEIAAAAPTPIFSHSRREYGPGLSSEIITDQPEPSAPGCQDLGPPAQIGSARAGPDLLVSDALRLEVVVADAFAEGAADGLRQAETERSAVCGGIGRPAVAANEIVREAAD